MAAPLAKLVAVVAALALPEMLILHVPEAPEPDVGTNAPAEPTLTASAVATPVPNPLTPVEIGRLVQKVRVPLLGVPNAPPGTI